MQEQHDHEALPLDSVEILPYLPLIYVAWADGDLTAAEIREICLRVEGADGIHTTCSQLLGRWLDPNRPPTARELGALLSTIRREGARLEKEKGRSLAELGAELAQAGDRELSEQERQALSDLEGALGVNGAEASRSLLAEERPRAEPEGLEASFDLQAMTALLDGDKREIRERVRRLLRDPEFRHVYELERSEYRERVLGWCRRLAAEGLGRLSFPESCGGRDDIGASVAAFETLAFFDLSLLTKFGVQFGLFGGSILQLGSERHHRRYLERVGSLELPGCFAMTEVGHGSNVQELETVARFDPASDEFVLETPGDSARKDWIGNAAEHGRLATVFAQLEIGEESHGVHAFLVPIRDEEGRVLPGVHIEDCGEKMGLNGVDNGRIQFQGVRIPRENLLDRFARVDADGSYSSPIASPARRFFTMLGTLVGGRISVASAAVSVAKSALTIAVRYGGRRRQFGPPGKPEILLLDYRTHQRRLLPRLATTYALNFALHDLQNRFASVTDENRRELEGLAAGLKAYSTWHATDTTQACREACGGRGYLTVNRFAALKADSDVFTTYEGDNTVLLQLVAKGLLMGYRRQFSEMSVLGAVRYLADRTTAAVTELNPVVTRRTDEEHLRDREFHLAAMSWRESRLLSSLARRIKSRIDDGMESFDALVEVQDHALALAKAHVERVVLESFVAAVERCEDEGLRRALDRLCDLYALHRIEAGSGWYLEQGYLEAGKAKAVRAQVNRLCREVRQEALALVEVFAIPDSCLAAPIAL